MKDFKSNDTTKTLAQEKPQPPKITLNKPLYETFLKDQSDVENINGVTFIISEGQIKEICKYFNQDVSSIEEYEICELLDRIIDNLN